MNIKVSINSYKQIRTALITFALIFAEASIFDEQGYDKKNNRIFHLS